MTAIGTAPLPFSAADNPRPIAPFSIDALYAKAAVLKPYCVRSIPPQIKSIDNTPCGWTTGAQRNGADDHIGMPAVFGKGSRTRCESDGMTPDAVDTAQMIANKPVVPTSPSVRPGFTATESP